MKNFIAAVFILLATLAASCSHAQFPGEVCAINKVWASPASGSAGPLTCRALVSADLPAGSGVTGSGLINQLAWFASSGSVISGLTTANSAVLCTSGGGVPSLCTQLPTHGVGIAASASTALNLPAGTTGVSSLNVQCSGAAPTSPVNGDVWCTSAGGLFVRVNGVTVGPLGTGIGSSVSVTGGVTAYNATAIPAGGTAGTGFTYSSTSNFGTFFGSGAPTLSAAQGSLYTRSDGAGLLYVNTNGTTGWGALVSATIQDQTVSGGANITANNLGTQSSGTLTIDCGKSPLQYVTDGGAFTLAAPANDGSCIVLVTNNGSAGTITFSGFTVGSNTGDAITTTNTQKFSLSIWRINGTSGYRIAAHQ